MTTTSTSLITKEDYCLKLIFEVINHNDFLRTDPNVIMKNFNLDDNLYYKILKRKKDNLDSINRVYYIQEVLLLDLII